MSDNYAVINGRRIKLTDEQVKTLGIERKNPFERVANGDVYYRVAEDGNVDEYTECGDFTDSNLYNDVNYFNDDSVAQQVALHQLLYRKLLKFSYDNECEDIEWDLRSRHWYIFYNYTDKYFYVQSNDLYKHQDVYFASQALAEQAIKEVVEPFIEEHPEFEW